MVHKETLKTNLRKIMNAYLSDKLNKQSCQGDPVTAILGSNAWGAVFRTVKYNGELQQLERGKLMSTIAKFGSPPQLRFILEKEDEGQELIDKSPYSYGELKKIEYAYQTTPNEGPDKEFNIYNSVMSAVDVLIEIHQVEDHERDKVYSYLSSD